MLGLGVHGKYLTPNPFLPHPPFGHPLLVKERGTMIVVIHSLSFTRRGCPNAVRAGEVNSSKSG